jgi:hypothetical protein
MEVGKLLDLAGVAEKQNPRRGKNTVFWKVLCWLQLARPGLV